jgi:hypothetical protein
MAKAEKVLREAARTLPPDLQERLKAADKMTDGDHDAISRLAKQSLIPFLPKPEPPPQPEAVKGAKPEPIPQTPPQTQVKS